jgi:hypothetical protein
MFVVAPLRSGTSGIFDVAPLDPVAVADPSIVTSRLQEAAASTEARRHAGTPLQRRAFPSVPFYGILSTLSVDVSRRKGHAMDPGVLHRRIQNCVAQCANLYHCGTSSHFASATVQSSNGAAGSYAAAPQQSPLLMSKYVDAFCDAFLKLETACMSQASGGACRDVLVWSLERHERFRDSRCIFFVEDGRLCCFLHTSSGLLRAHLDKWLARIATAGDALGWVDGGVLLQDPPRQIAAHGTSARSGLSAVRAMFDMLLNLKLHGAGDTAALPAKGTSPASSSLAVSSVRLALSPATVFVPVSLQLSVAASFPFLYAEHRAPNLRAVKKINRRAEARAVTSPGVDGGEVAVDDDNEEEELYCWTLAALPGYYILPPVLSAVVRCLRDECRVDQFVLRMTAVTGRGGQPLVSSHAAAAGAPTGLRVLASAASPTGQPQVSYLSPTSVPLLVFSRLSSDEWIDADVKRLYDRAEDDEAGAGDLEFFPSVIHFRRSELLTAKRTREDLAVPAAAGEFAISVVVVYAPAGPAAEVEVPALDSTV